MRTPITIGGHLLALTASDAQEELRQGNAVQGTCIRVDMDDDGVAASVWHVPMADSGPAQVHAVQLRRFELPCSTHCNDDAARRKAALYVRDLAVDFAYRSTPLARRHRSESRVAAMVTGVAWEEVCSGPFPVQVCAGSGEACCG